MGIFDGFAEGLASAIDDIRHQVIEQPMYGQQTTGNIELPQVEAPTIEPASTGIVDLTPSTADPSWGVSSAAIEPPIEPVSWQQAAQDIQTPQIEPPAPSHEMER
jgi:hypothetical protein